MKITLNTTWDEVTREIRSDGTDDQRALCDLATAEIDELEATVDEFQSFVDSSPYDTVQDALQEMEDLKFERDFMKLFFKCQ